MKDKFIRVLSPITAIVVALLDVAVLSYGVFAIKKITEERTTAVIFFAAIEVFAVIVAILVTKEVLKNGVVFRDDEFEFTGLDNNNIFNYDNIESVETYKDDKPSLVKNFVDRHGVLTLSLKKEDKLVSIDIGLCRKYTLELIAKEIAERCNIEYVILQETPSKKLTNNKEHKEQDNEQND